MPSQVFTSQCLRTSLPHVALASHSPSVPLHFSSRPIIAIALQCSTIPLHYISVPRLRRTGLLASTPKRLPAGPFDAMPPHCESCLCIAAAIPFIAFARPFESLPLLALALRCQSYQRRSESSLYISSAAPVQASLSRCFSILRNSHAGLCTSKASPGQSQPLLCLTILLNALADLNSANQHSTFAELCSASASRISTPRCPSGSGLCHAAAIHFVAILRQCQSMRCHCVALLHFAITVHSHAAADHSKSLPLRCQSERNVSTP